MHGIRSACHLLVYGCGTDPLVCIVGNFDGGLWQPDDEWDRGRGYGGRCSRWQEGIPVAGVAPA